MLELRLRPPSFFLRVRQLGSRWKGRLSNGRATGGGGGGGSERLIFDDIYKRLERDLAEKKREMAQVLEVSNKAYEARDAALSEMQRLI